MLSLSTCRLSTLLVGGALCALAPLSHAAERIEEVHVSGRQLSDLYRFRNDTDSLQSGLSLMEAPVSLQQVPRAVLLDQRAESFEDAMRNVSGVNSMFYLGGAYERFVVRGFTQSLAGYRNGVLQPFNRFHIANTERVEVLKGPAGLEYGVSDPGGIINLVTRTPAKRDALAIEQTASTYDRYTTVVNANQVVNDQFAFRIDASYVTDKGFRELTDSEEHFIAPSLRFSPSENTEILIGFEQDKSDRAYDAGLPALGDGLLPVSIEKNYSDTGLVDDYDTKVYELMVDHTFIDTWNVKVGYTYFQTDNYFRSLYAYGDLQPGDTQADRYAWFGPEDLDSYSLYGLVRGAFTTGTIEHKLVIGAQRLSMHLDASASETYVDTINVYNYSYTDAALDVGYYESLPTDTFISYQRDQTDRLFVQDSLYVGDNWIVSLGLSYDQLDRSLDSAYYSPVEHSERDDSDTSPRAGITYKLSPFTSLFVNYATSFGPAFNYEPSALYEPEEATQYEAGIKAQFNDGRSLLTVSLFELKKSNITVPGGAPNTTESVGEARSRGIEIDWVGQLTGNLSLLANYAFTDTEVTRDAADIEGNWLPNAPEHKAGGWLRYDVPVFSGLSVGGGFTYAGKCYGDTRNTYHDDAYTQWDLFTGYAFKVGDSDVLAQLNLQNITDEEYFSMRARWTNMPAAPFTAIGSLKVAF